MQTSKSAFIIRLVVFSMVLCAILIIIKTFVSASWAPDVVWSLVPVYALLTAFMHFRMIKGDAYDGRRFVSNFLMLTALKLLILVVIIVLYCLIFREYARPLLIWFLALYFFFTVFETMQLFNHYRSKKVRSAESESE